MAFSAGGKNMKKQKPLSNDADPEIFAISAVYAALKDLDQDEQGRVIEYVRNKLGHKSSSADFSQEKPDETGDEATPPSQDQPQRDEVPSSAGRDETWDSVSAVAKKWVQRNDLDRKYLITIFSIGGEEIDLIAKSIPGKSKRQRMREVVLLKGIAAYLGSGVARITHEALKEACSHYGALDSPNFATYMKEFSAEVSGSKESGYTLSARGLVSGAELIKEMKEKKK
jgi:hypothetical protein